MALVANVSNEIAIRSRLGTNHRRVIARRSAAINGYGFILGISQPGRQFQSAHQLVTALDEGSLAFDAVLVILVKRIAKNFLRQKLKVTLWLLIEIKDADDPVQTIRKRLAGELSFFRKLPRGRMERRRDHIEYHLICSVVVESNHAGGLVVAENIAEFQGVAQINARDVIDHEIGPTRLRIDAFGHRIASPQRQLLLRGRSKGGEKSRERARSTAAARRIRVEGAHQPRRAVAVVVLIGNDGIVLDALGRAERNGLAKRPVFPVVHVQAVGMAGRSQQAGESITFSRSEGETRQKFLIHNGQIEDAVDFAIVVISISPLNAATQLIRWPRGLQQQRAAY